ncbi:HEAT repeat domain-containing protein [Archangium violaceum]|uniref:HEAT repeat domain-containing protein n=1 Tax=Archangium violaceum TaxID=83451 RepID=UPI002B2AF5FE|nr:HEAT repeat domain-containing protein [Archangium gephyra]
MANQEIEKLLTLCRTGTAEEQCKAIVDLEDLRAREAVPVLLGLTSSPDPGVRANVATALGVLGSCESVAPVLLSLLEDPDDLVRVDAIQSLEELRCVECVPHLMRLLASDPDGLVRLQAAETLGVLKDRAALPSLTAALRDPDEGVRSYAAGSLGQLGERGVMPELRALLAAEQDPMVRASVYQALYQLGDEEALALLLDGVDAVDDLTAATMLNMAVRVIRPQQAELLRSRLQALRRSRPGLEGETESLLRKVPGSAPG